MFPIKPRKPWTLGRLETSTQKINAVVYVAIQCSSATVRVAANINNVEDVVLSQDYDQDYSLVLSLKEDSINTHFDFSSTLSCCCLLLLLLTITSKHSAIENYCFVYMLRL